MSPAQPVIAIPSRLGDLVASGTGVMRQLKLVASDARHLDRTSEQRLTDWMRTHLEVAVHPFATPDSLADLERHVLSELDPPLNLDGQPSNTVPIPLASL